MTATDPIDVARRRLLAVTRWSGDRLATLRWWADPDLLAALGPGLAALHADARPTVVLGVQSSGYLLAPLVATRLGVGMCGVQQHRGEDGVTLAAEPDALGRGDRVLVADDVVETGEQLAAVRDYVEHHGATWLGASVMVAYRPFPELAVRSLVGVEELTSRR